MAISPMLCSACMSARCHTMNMTGCRVLSCLKRSSCMQLRGGLKIVQVGRPDSLKNCTPSPYSLAHAGAHRAFCPVLLLHNKNLRPNAQTVLMPPVPCSYITGPGKRPHPKTHQHAAYWPQPKPACAWHSALPATLMAPWSSHPDPPPKPARSLPLLWQPWRCHAAQSCRKPSTAAEP